MSAITYEELVTQRRRVVEQRNRFLTTVHRGLKGYTDIHAESESLRADPSIPAHLFDGCLAIESQAREGMAECRRLMDEILDTEIPELTAMGG